MSCRGETARERESVELQVAGRAGEREVEKKG